MGKYKIMRILRSLVAITTLVIFLISCSHANMVTGVPIKKVSPKHRVTISCDTLFNVIFPEDINFLDLQIVKDSILVIQSQTSEDNPFHFYAYSLNDFRQLGQFIPKGRGPGEMLSPHIARCSPENTNLCISDNSQGLSYYIDVLNPSLFCQSALIQTTKLPLNTIDWIPVTDSIQLTMNVVGDDFVYFAINMDGDIVKSYFPYTEVPAQQCVTHMSGVFTSNVKNGMVASAMCFFPQITTININNDKISSYAVNKDYKKWNKIINSRLDGDSFNYYSSITSTSEYIMATYYGIPLSAMAQNKMGSKIHIFSWDGDFLYEISIKEDIGHIAYDRENQYMYCIENKENKIIRYNLSGVDL